MKKTSCQGEPGASGIPSPTPATAMECAALPPTICPSLPFLSAQGQSFWLPISPALAAIIIITGLPLAVRTCASRDAITI
jgi:hypothetical protein